MTYLQGHWQIMPANGFTSKTDLLFICDKNLLRMQKRLDGNKIFLRVKHKTLVLERPLPYE